MSELLLEISHQILPPGTLNADLTSESLEFAAPSMPLYHLERGVGGEHIVYPEFAYSNDEAAAYYQQTRVRTESQDFRTATNRVALVVGEGSLAAALGQDMIPEETILLTDINPEHNDFMIRYVTALRKCATPEAWRKEMGVMSARELGLLSRRDRRSPERLEFQIAEWEDAGFKHALSDQASYDRARENACKKAFIVAQVDLSDEGDTWELGAVLRNEDAHITMANLTNILGASDLVDASGLANILAQLPFTESAPILTTSAAMKSKPDRPDDDYITEATGPFFGLQNFGNCGGPAGITGGRGGAAVQRQFVDPAARTAQAEKITAQYSPMTLPDALQSVVEEYMRRRQRAFRLYARSAVGVGYGVFLGIDGIATENKPEIVIGSSIIAAIGLYTRRKIRDYARTPVVILDVVIPESCDKSPGEDRPS